MFKVAVLKKKVENSGSGSAPAVCVIVENGENVGMKGGKLWHSARKRSYILQNSGDML